MKETSGKEEGEHPPAVMGKLNRSAILVIVGIILLFSIAVMAVLVAPGFADSTWTTPSSSYQVQMYEIADPQTYMSSVSRETDKLQYVHHLKQDVTLLGFKESKDLQIIAGAELEKYITRDGDPELKLTSRLLMLRDPEGSLRAEAERLQKKWQQEKQEREARASKEEKLKPIQHQVLELYDPGVQEAFSIDLLGGIFQDWVDKEFKILDGSLPQRYPLEGGFVYVLNPREFRITLTREGDEECWRYDAGGRPVKDLAELKSPLLGFHSRQELISLGEEIYAIEGCWYCHTDQTRTLIGDVVLNGTDVYPAPPSSANEFIYQKVTFPGTRRIGPDLSREGVNRPSREWHQAHFWSPKTAVVGSIMPAFQHFFDQDPRRKGKPSMGIPNIRFEAIYQYMMTKGTRITPPTQAWWLGQDSIKTKERIEGQRLGLRRGS